VLSPNSTRLYRGTAPNFLTDLGAHHPEVSSLSELRPTHTSPDGSSISARASRAPVPYISRLIFLRGTLAELSGSAPLRQLAPLLRRQDVPRAPRRLPRALTRPQHQLLQQELRHRNDLAAKVFQLLRRPCRSAS